MKVFLSGKKVGRGTADLRRPRLSCCRRGPTSQNQDLGDRGDDGDEYDDDDEDDGGDDDCLSFEFCLEMFGKKTSKQICSHLQGSPCQPPSF